MGRTELTCSTAKYSGSQDIKSSGETTFNCVFLLESRNLLSKRKSWSVIKSIVKMLIAICSQHWRILGVWEVWETGQPQQAQAELWHSGPYRLSTLCNLFGVPLNLLALLIDFQVEAIKGKPRLILVAAQDIEEGEELTYDYGIK